MATGDIWRVSIEGEALTDSFVNVLHYQEGFGWDGDLASLAQGIWDGIGATYVAMLADSYTATNLSLRGVTNPTQGFDLALSDPGTQTGDRLPTQTAGVITWRTGLIGRSYRGRSYIGPMVETVSNGGYISSPQLAVMDTFADAAKTIIEALPGTGVLQLGVYSRKLSQFTAVTAHESQQIMGTQRRRRPGVGD